MASTQSFSEYVTSSSSFIVATNLNLISTNTANGSTSIYPVVAGSYTYEKKFKIAFGGTFTSISAIKFYKSDGALVTGEVLNYTGQVTTWSSPTNSVSSDADTAIPTSEPSTANVSITGTLSGSLSAAGSSDWIVLQGSYSANTSAGSTNEKTFTFSWTET